MNSFKPGDWVILSNDNCLAQVKETYPDSNKAKLYWPSEESTGICSEMQYYELWQPKVGEWIWSKGSYTQGFIFKWTSAHKQIGIPNYANYEPFIGQLPTHLKDQS